MNTTELKKELKRALPKWRDLTEWNRHGELLEEIAYFFAFYCRDDGDNDKLTSFKELYFMLRQLNGMHRMLGKLSWPLATIRNTIDDEMMKLVKEHFGQEVLDLVKEAF